MNADEFWRILHDVPESKPVFWRLYYSDNGDLVCYSMEDLPYNYIDIDPELYHQGPLNVRVINGDIRYLHRESSRKLIPGNNGTACDPCDVTVIVNNGPNTKWAIKNYDKYN